MTRPNASEPPTTANTQSMHRREIRGIPLIKEPTLPPKTAASLMACTRTRRAYWVIFKHTEAGWRWERNIPAVPLLDKKAHTAEGIVTSKNTDTSELSMGGEYWGDWSCPGCGKKQLKQGDNYLHHHYCRCGMSCCLGGNPSKQNPSTCPNCGRKLRTIAWINRTLSTVTRGKLDLGDSRTLPGPDRREIEG